MLHPTSLPLAKTRWILRIRGTNRTLAVLLFMAGTLASWAQPANDDPCGATPLTVNTSCSTVASTNSGATNTAGIPAPGCGNFLGTSRDVWFSFVAPASGSIVIQSTSGTLTDGAMALYSATGCAGVNNTIDCDDDSGPGLMPILSNFNLTPGTTYYIRFWGFGNATGTFNICVWSPALTAGTCTYALEMYDSGNNGWGSSAVTVTINGVATNYTVTGNYALNFIAVNAGNTLSVSYNNSGPNQNQNEYWLRQVPGGAGVFLSGRPPVAGAVFSETVDCVPPSRLPEDCIGGITVCGDATLNNNSTHTGFDPDLAGDNFGCLSSAERQGRWYHFRIASGGTIGFTITPVTLSNDYDFAVWGPYTSMQCPPPAQPLRCSYSAFGGTTGCGNGAVDLSEGSGGDRWVRTFDVLTGEQYILYVSNFSQSGIAAGISWQLANGASLDCTVLPVEMTAFDAMAMRTGVALEWTTATEIENDHFDVERSFDGLAFEHIGTVAGSGTTLTPVDYHFLDSDPVRGVNYYRLRQVDHDGAFEFSPVRSVHYGGAPQPHIVQPNPVDDELSVVVNVASDGPGSLRVIDPNGRLVIDRSLELRQGAEQVIRIHDIELPTGAYHLTIIQGSGAILASAMFIKY